MTAYLRPNATNPGLMERAAAATTSAGAGDANRLVALNASGKVDSTALPGGIGGRIEQIQASETLVAGDLVNIHNVGGRRVRKADASQATASRLAQGFVLAGIASGATGDVYLDGEEITGLTGLTPGTEYYLSGSAAGTFTATPPATAGHAVQSIGFATDTASIQFDPQFRYLA